MTESYTLSDKQRWVLGKLIRARFDGYVPVDGNDERTLRSLRRRGLCERREGTGRWWPTADALGYDPDRVAHG